MISRKFWYDLQKYNVFEDQPKRIILCWWECKQWTFIYHSLITKTFSKSATFHDIILLKAVICERLRSFLRNYIDLLAEGKKFWWKTNAKCPFNLQNYFIDKSDISAVCCWSLSLMKQGHIPTRWFLHWL